MRRFASGPPPVATIMLALLASSCADASGSGESGSGDSELLPSTLTPEIDGLPRLVPGEPELVLGSADGPGMLYRVGGVVAWPGGGVAVLLQTERLLRVFGPDGEHRFDVGRPGEGPGEFGYLAGLQPWRGDSLVVLDGGNRRLAFVDAASRDIRTAPLPDLGANLTGLHGPLADGSLVVETASFQRQEGERFAQERVFRRWTPRAERMDSLFALPNWEYVVIEGVLTGTPLSRLGAVAVQDGALHAVVSDRGALMRWTGDSLAAVRDFRETAAWSPGELDAYWDRRLEADPARREMIETLRGLGALTEQANLHDRLLAGPEGTLLVRDFHPYQDPGQTVQRWIVLNPDGVPEAVVEMPADWNPLGTVNGLLAVVETDELDVQRVTLRPILRRVGPGL